MDQRPAIITEEQFLTFIEYQPVPEKSAKYTVPSAATEIRFNCGISCENDII